MRLAAKDTQDTETTSDFLKCSRIILVFALIREALLRCVTITSKLIFLMPWILATDFWSN